MQNLQENVSLTPALYAQLNTLARDGETKRLKQLEQIISDKVNDWMVKLRSIPQGITRAKVVHSLVDSLQAKTTETKFSCHQGCSFCCHTQVSLGKSEALRIEETVAGRSLDFERLQRQAKVSSASFYNQELSWENSACVFLNAEGACTIYESRPLSCRKVLVISPPKLCDPRQTNTPSYWINLEVESIAAAFYNVEIADYESLTTISKFFAD